MLDVIIAFFWSGFFPLWCRWIRKCPILSRFSCQHSSSRPCGFHCCCCCWTLQWYLRDSQCHCIVYHYTISTNLVLPLMAVFSVISVTTVTVFLLEIQGQFSQVLLLPFFHLITYPIKINGSCAAGGLGKLHLGTSLYFFFSSVIMRWSMLSISASLIFQIFFSISIWPFHLLCPPVGSVCVFMYHIYETRDEKRVET